MKEKGLYNSSSCIGFKCKKLNKSALKFYNTKHKFKPSCFNSCVEWTLNISFLHDKINFSNKIKGNNLFFRSLEKSALNELTAKGGLKNKNIYESPTFSDLSNLQLKNINENFDELLNIKFPINNKTFNYMIIDANLAIKENLQNIFLIEFDLLNNVKDNNNNKFWKLLREINHPEREIFFVLNGTIHGINLFTSELKFSVEQSKFIKSIKFKLDTYKKDLINQKMQHPNSPDKLKIKNSFFAKVLCNTNIGIEFSKPRFDMRNPEKFQTNFNSIVNSKVKINKIFLEVSIPKSFLSSNDYLTRIDDKIEEDEKEIPDIQLDKFNENISNEKTATSSFNINNNNTNSNSNINNTGFNSPNLSSLENMMSNNNIYSKSSLRNKQINIPSLNQNFNLNFLNIKDNLHNSPHLGYSYPKFQHHPQQHNIMTPDNLSLIFGGGGRSLNNNTFNNINNSTISSSIHFSPNFNVGTFNSYLPVSPGGRSYIGTINNNQFIFNNFSNNNINNSINNKPYSNMPNLPPFELDPNNSMLSRYSENSIFSESLNNNINVNSPRSVIDYPSNYYKAGFSNINNNLSVRSFGRGSFYKGHNNLNNLNNISFNLNINNGYKSPRNVSNLNFTKLNIFEEKKIFNGIPTIKKKIMDWENSKDKKEVKEENNINKDENNKIINIKNKDNIFEKNKLLNLAKIDSFINYYENNCNYIIFLRSSNIYINTKLIYNYKCISLEQFFESFKKISLFGMQVNYLSNIISENDKINKKILNIVYSLTLSSLEIILNDKVIILKIIDYLISINKCPNQLRSKIEESYSNQKEQIFSYTEFFPLENDPSLKIKLIAYSNLTIEYKENKPPHLRPNFYHKILDIINILSLNDIELSKIIGNSFFSIRYTPYNNRNKNDIQTSFVNYYQFKINEEMNNSGKKFIDIPLIGMLPLKFNHAFFLEKINKGNYINNNLTDIMIVNKLVQNVINNLMQNNGENSIDVEYYLNQQIN